MERLIELLHSNNHSLVVSSASGEIRCYDGRGVSDLYNIYVNDASFLDGASIADKVVGLGAAAIMALGNVKKLHTDVISEDASDLLARYGLDVSYSLKVPYIINRSRTGRCPLESLLADNDTSSLEYMWAVIKKFVSDMTSNR